MSKTTIVKYLPFMIVSPLVLILDQLSKGWVHANLALGEHLVVIPGYFEIAHARNRGAAFGFLSDWDSPFRQYFFYGVGILAFVTLFAIYYHSDAKERRIHWPLSLIFGGALGNLVDRFIHGEVIDFLRFHWRNEVLDFTIFGYHFHSLLIWPSFNVADMAISVGAILAAIIILFFTPHERKAKK